MRTAYEIITAEFGRSRNFMTPTIEGYDEIVPGKLVYELSAGRGIANQPIYAVTVVRVLPNGATERCIKLSDCFQSKAQRDAHIASLRTSFATEEDVDAIGH